MLEVTSTLKIHKLILAVRLGCTAGERSSAQKTEWNIEIFFSEAPAACGTDQLKDSICYHEICKTLETLCYSAEFHLIEHLCSKAVEVLKPVLARAHSARVEVKKLFPPIDFDTQGMSFSLTWRNA